MNTITLSPDSVKAIAAEAARIAVELLRKERQPELVTTAEAAKILGYTPQYMREVADRYPHIRQCHGTRTRLLFKREGLTN